MAKNPNPPLKNKHTLYVGMSGTGKSQALKQNKEIRGRVVLWDMSHDHAQKDTFFYDDKQQFILALAAASKKAKFRIAWSGDSSPQTLEWFFRVVWTILDGKKITFVIVEELARAVETVGRALPELRKFCNEARKYGGILQATTQRPQEIPKTVYDTINTYWVGKQKAVNIKKFADLIDVSELQIKELQPLEFYFYDESSIEPAKKIKLKYKK